jgi:hypothetical protein
MKTTPILDPRASDLISRVSEDVSLLRQDIGNLVSHTAHHTLPTGVRELADNAKHRLADGKLFTAEQLRALRNQVNQPAAAWLGGAALLGLVAAGGYLLFRGHGNGLSDITREHS